MRVSHRSHDRAAWTRVCPRSAINLHRIVEFEKLAALTATFHGMITVTELPPDACAGFFHSSQLGVGLTVTAMSLTSQALL
jgi:hypothetical protein